MHRADERAASAADHAVTNFSAHKKDVCVGNKEWRIRLGKRCEMGKAIVRASGGPACVKSRQNSSIAEAACRKTSNAKHQTPNAKLALTECFEVWCLAFGVPTARGRYDSLVLISTSHASLQQADHSQTLRTFSLRSLGRNGFWRNSLRLSSPKRMLASCSL